MRLVIKCSGCFLGKNDFFKRCEKLNYGTSPVYVAGFALLYVYCLLFSVASVANSYIASGRTVGGRGGGVRDLCAEVTKRFKGGPTNLAPIDQ